jgi:hypothetical protein
LRLDQSLAEVSLIRPVYSDGRTRNEEPLVNAGVDWCRSLVGAGGNLAELGGVDTVRRVVVGDVGQRHTARRSLASDQALPCIAALVDDFLSVLLVLAFTTEGELVLGLSIWDLVDAEPLIGGTEQARKMTLDVFDIVEFWGKRVVDVDDDDLPVGLLLVQESHDTQDLDLLDLTSVANNFADLADIEWVVVAFSLGLGMDNIRVFPGLHVVSMSQSCQHRV